ncbi:MAG: hypothetical protein ABIE22_05550 [archaeon]
MDLTDIISTKALKIALSFDDDLRKDFDGLVCRMAGIGKRHPMLDDLPEVKIAERKILYFIANHVGMWKDTERDWTLQWGLNNKAGVYDDYHFGGSVLNSFKAYEQLWASRKHTGSNKGNWYKMQDELADYINLWTPKDAIYYQDIPEDHD